MQRRAAIEESASWKKHASEAPYLAAFYAVCTQGGFSAAARALGCTQPAVSYQVRCLEAVLGMQLVERGGHRGLLTAEGERVRAMCERFFSDLHQVRGELAGGVVAEPVRIAAASGFGRYVLLPALRALRKGDALGTAELRLWFDSASVVLDSLERGECEAAFVYTRRESNRLRYRAVYNEELVLIRAATTSKRGSSAVPDLATLEHTPFVTYEEGDYVFSRWFESNFGDQLSALASTAFFSELEEVIAFVADGAGYSIVPRDAAESAKNRGEIEFVYAGRSVPCMNQVFLAVRSGARERAAVNRIAEALVTHRSAVAAARTPRRRGAR